MAGDDSAFWRFSLRFYRRPEVPPLCLALQDQHDADVNLLFFILFLATNRRQLSVDDVRAIDASIRDWRERVVQPLRAVRRDLKTGIKPIDAQVAEALRSAIKRDELQAERLQQEALEQNFLIASTGIAATIRTAAAANLAAYGEVIGALPQATVNALLNALFEEFSV